MRNLKCMISDQKIDLSISVAILNQKDVTEKFIESLYKYTDIPFELIIVDNGSDEETKQYLNDIFIKHKNISILTKPKNEGFGKAHNDSVKIAKGKYFSILNN